MPSAFVSLGVEHVLVFDPAGLPARKLDVCPVWPVLEYLDSVSGFERPHSQADLGRRIHHVECAGENVRHLLLALGSAMASIEIDHGRGRDHEEHNDELRLNGLLRISQATAAISFYTSSNLTMPETPRARARLEQLTIPGP